MDTVGLWKVVMGFPSLPLVAAVSFPVITVGLSELPKKVMKDMGLGITIFSLQNPPRPIRDEIGLGLKFKSRLHQNTSLFFETQIKKNKNGTLPIDPWPDVQDHSPSIFQGNALYGLPYALVVSTSILAHNVPHLGLLSLGQLGI